VTAARFNAVAYGVDDLTLGFDMEGSPSVSALNAAPGSQTRRGKMLGERASWGKWVHLLGRSVSFWKADTKRLYVQAKLADEGQLCPPREIEVRTVELIERMAAAGVVSYEHPWVTRVDVAVDAECASADGKLLLDALEAVRLPNGWRTTSTGSPRSTVYFRARVSEHVHARAYCRNLKTKSGEPYGCIRLEAEQRFDPKECPLEYAEQPAFIATIWKGRYTNLASKVTRLAREVQAMELAERMQRGELRHGEAERLHLFLDLERLGHTSVIGSRCTRCAGEKPQSSATARMRFGLTGSTSNWRICSLNTCGRWTSTRAAARRAGGCRPPAAGRCGSQSHGPVRGIDPERGCRSVCV
jgi:hypothetical protein